MYICTNPTGYIANRIPTKQYLQVLKLGWVWTIVVLADVAPWRCGWSSGFLQHPSTNGWWSRGFKVGGDSFQHEFYDQPEFPSIVLNLYDQPVSSNSISHTFNSHFGDTSALLFTTIWFDQPAEDFDMIEPIICWTSLPRMLACWSQPGWVITFLWL